MASTLPTVLIYDVRTLQCDLLVQGLERLLPNFRVQSIHDVDALLELVRSEGKWIVLITDPSAGARSLTVARRLGSLLPSVPFIVFLEAGQRAAIVEAFRTGAKGVISSNETLADVAKCIHFVSMGEMCIKRGQLRQILEALIKSEPKITDASGKRLLTPREEGVSALVAEGLSNREISSALNLTENTVKNYIFHIFEKLGISNRVELVRYIHRSSEPAREEAVRNSVKARG